ncbi:glycoside hydrolase family 16 protein [Lichenicola cladoniae]|uniref:Glycoside hydrolase family 16 protein n=1 Tax=Lichenicola cladoniae TaxID=1484109 RepID=A0A6M8H584_9PROT|nr:glycoside hydrolase family 16 protein [Lichenicola cladoniae]NPD65157.1 glycoside hydrolase family 16 protein [Acetobacteraceae bacterium]QKE88761.1 glycoside hydrolase family 16 protein [Lichenicola cladoniae]
MGLVCAAVLAGLVCVLTPNPLLAETGSAADKSGRPILDLAFSSVPNWRSGPMPWPPLPKPFDDKDFILSAGLMSGLRPAFDKRAGTNSAWASLSNEEEAYPDADAMRLLQISPYSMLDGALAITAASMPASAAKTLPRDMVRRYLSGALNTYPFSQTYGYFEITASVPSGDGLWPAFWLLPVDQAWPPEIDIAEVLGGDSRTAYFSLHSSDLAWVHAEPHSYNNSTTTDSSSAAGDLSQKFHRYAVDWQPDFITFYLDDAMVGRHATPRDMNKPFYLIINLAVGGPGSWPGPTSRQTRFPAVLAIRSIKIWKRQP